jgi:hypothetical protein
MILRKRHLLGGLLALPLLPYRALAQPLPPPFSAAVQSGALERAT